MGNIYDYIDQDNLPWENNEKQYVGSSSAQTDGSMEKVISGMGIQSDDATANAEENIKLLKNLNVRNTHLIQEELEVEREAERLQEEADKRLRNAAREKILKERYERELAERQAREEEEAREEARLLELARQKRQANPVRRLLKNIYREELKEEAKEEGVKERGGFKSMFRRKTEKEKSVACSDGRDTSYRETDWEYMAMHDNLTGLLNTMAFEKAKDKTHPKGAAVIFVDVNDLKAANDQYGHAAGDRLIIAVGSSLNEIWPQSAYRVGGDEFVILLSKPLQSAYNVFLTASKK